jgi:hypothetical protein
MKLKLDENLGKHASKILDAAGHEVSTVLSGRIAP